MSEHTSPNPTPVGANLASVGIAAWWERTGATFRALPKPLKVLLLAIGTVAVLLIGYFSMLPLMQDYAVLYSQLDSKDAGAMVAKLDELEIPYRLSGGGTTIEVPEDEVHKLRLAMATEGLPQGGQVGFETFENLRLGATEFEQHVTYRRAMEGELARTIGTVHNVQSARVHLVLPKKSVFSSRSEPASASVIVALQSGNEPSREEVKGIVYLVSSAVPSLQPNQVTLVTTDGRTLHRPKPVTDGEQFDGMGDGEHDQLSRNHAYEALLEERTRSLLERVLGPGHVDVRVQAELDSARVESKQDTYDPKTSVLRSERLLLERTAGGAMPQDTVAGVPGAESNLPTGDGELEGEEPVALDATTSRRSHTRNWEVDHLQVRRVSFTQSVKRLTVAVVVDGVSQTVDGETVVELRPREELDKLASLVQSAVGYDESRGDQVTIESVAFQRPPPIEEEALPPLVPIPDEVRRWLPVAKPVGIGIIKDFYLSYLYI